ncbi:MAG TPA: V-type ATP synthase subunit D [Nitrososphaeraceae archaeon]|jgi:V/A-type H+-transporting ATPase subunit D|nr:V-type ATP synthase subunit D [Nitrososphaeraceae archaeon]
MSFGKQVIATKIELIKIRRSMQISKMVHKILDDKREVLLKKIDEMIDEANKAREDIWDPLDDIYKSIFQSYLTLGNSVIQSLASSTPPSIAVDVHIKRIVDVKIPSLEVSTKNKSPNLTYGFSDTNSSLDQATKLIRDILPGICKAAEYENAIFSLAKELEKTQKLINALEYVIIPQYQNALTFIKSTLEEREREEFVRLKKVKAVIERKASK